MFKKLRKGSDKYYCYIQIFLYGFERPFLFLPRLHLFDQNTAKSSVKYYYN